LLAVAAEPVVKVVVLLVVKVVDLVVHMLVLDKVLLETILVCQHRSRQLLIQDLVVEVQTTPKEEMVVLVLS
jgi:hypothetical protein